MPELPEVETVRAGLEKTVAGAVIERVEVRRDRLRLPVPQDFAKVLEGRKIRQIVRRAKYLLLRLSGGKTVILHLGMSGKVLVKQEAPGAYHKHDHLVLHLGKGRVVLFHDPRRFGLATLIETQQEKSHPLLRNIGAEPLEAAFTGRTLHALLAGKKAPVKTAIMDQRLIAGVGNIYASEALFESGVHPLRKAGTLSRAQCQALAKAIKKVLRAAIQSGGSTLRDYVRSDGDVGYFQHRFKVYGKDGKPCAKCSKSIRQITQAGRSTFYCPSCQK